MALTLILPSAALAQGPVEAQGLAANLVKNFGFEEFIVNSGTDQVAKEWTAFTISGSPRFGQGTKLHTSPERIEGKDSQVLRMDELSEGGVYQIISGLTTGVWYSVVGYVLSIFETSAHADPSAFDGLIIKQIGVDPYGGRNALSEDIVWGPLIDKNADRVTWGERLTFLAQQSTATVFVRVECLRAVTPDRGYHTDVYIDAVQVRRSGVAQVTVPEGTQAGAFKVSWAATVPGATSTEASIIEYDVQYRDGIGQWQNWLQHYSGGSANFTIGKAGHTYAFRARAWARYGTAGVDRAEIFGPWAESGTVQLGQALELTVYDNHGNTVANMAAELRDSGGAVAATGTTNGSGLTYLAPGAAGQYDVLVTPFWFLAPEPVLGATVGTGIAPVGMSVRPPDDVVPDGSFEGAPAGVAPSEWTTIGDTAVVDTYDPHGGDKSLRLETGATAVGICVRRGFSLSDSYIPALSFWYTLLPPEGGSTKV
ncbi:MAG: hypothetical protein ACYC5O_03425, partial [Anaerolineae bacterium]